MSNQLVAILADDGSVLLDGQTLVGTDQVSNALRLALENDPHFILVIGPLPSGQYQGIGTIIYASQRVGLPVENLRLTMANGDLVTFDQMNTRNSTQSM